MKRQIVLVLFACLLSIKSCTDLFLFKNKETEKLYCITNTSYALSVISDNSNILRANKTSRFLPISYNTADQILPWDFQNETSESLILDRRWEKFIIENTLSIEGSKDVKIPISVFSDDGNVLINLCNRDAESGRKCFQFILNTSSITLNICQLLIYSSTRDFPCEQVNISGTDFFAKNLWHHFVLHFDSENIALLSSFHNVIFTSNFGTTFLFENGLNYLEVMNQKEKPAIWKLHKLFFLQTKNVGRRKIEEPVEAVDGIFCISLFTKMCKKCRIKLEIVDEHGNSSGNQTYAILHWKEIRFKRKGCFEGKYFLYIETISEKNSSADNFWSIDDIQQCGRTDYRFIEMENSTRCQLMHNSETIISLKTANFSNITNNNGHDTLHSCVARHKEKNDTKGIINAENKVLTAIICVIFVIISTIILIMYYRRKYRERTTKSRESVLSENQTCLNLLNKDNAELELVENYYYQKIRVEDFEKYFSVAEDANELEQQFNNLPFVIRESTYGCLPANTPKNRYSNVVAYDETRVILGKIQDEEFSDYINANYIDGYNSPRAYIATQCPTKSTVSDFWQMIWQENVEFIVMLANIDVDGPKKIHQYWPEGTFLVGYQEIIIDCISKKELDHYQYQIFSLKNKNKERKVYHFQFKAWPDHNIPDNKKFSAFFKKFQDLSSNSRGPVVVHCSAGVGRTGTIILCDICLKMAREENVVDVFNVLYKLRQQRPYMITRLEQYVLAHSIILEFLKSSIAEDVL